MFSALKRLTRSNNDGTTNNATSSGLHAMPSFLQKKFSKGIQYNMKIILKGDRNSGKSCLFRRLQGMPFQEEYNPTNEIQVANIQWNYKTTDDVVKVEIWDVVDKAKKKKQMSQTLKLENVEASATDAKEIEEIALDASFLDVYKNTQGVILIFDITKNWTFDYVKREIPLVPMQMPILILGNHRDMGHHRAITTDTVHYYIESLERKSGSGEIRYCESSMRNGFGLKFVHKFFNLPFLQLQKETLLKQLETNSEEKMVTIEELTLHLESDDANYDLFIDGLTQKRRLVADMLSPPTSKMTIEEAHVLSLAKDKEKELQSTGNPITGFLNSNSKLTLPKSKELSSPVPSMSATVSVSNATVDVVTPTKVLDLAPKNSQSDTLKSDVNKSHFEDPVADFVPEESGRIEGSFFTDHGYSTNVEPVTSMKDTVEISSDEETEGNPLVTSYIEDVDLDYHPVVTPKNHHHHRRKGNPSSSEEDVPPPVPKSQKKLLTTKVSLSPENSRKKERKRSKDKTKDRRHRHDSSKKHEMDLEIFLNGPPNERQRKTEAADYEEL